MYCKKKKECRSVDVFCYSASLTDCVRPRVEAGVSQRAGLDCSEDYHNRQKGKIRGNEVLSCFKNSWHLLVEGL